MLTEFDSCWAKGILNVLGANFLCEALILLPSLKITVQKEVAKTKNGTTTKKRITLNQLFWRVIIMYTRKEMVLSIQIK